MTLALLVIAALILGSAAVALSLRNLIHSALLFVLSWVGVAAFYLWAGAQFVAFAQILVYVGAVSMVVLFAVLLTRQGTPTPIEADSIPRVIGGLFAAGGVAGVLGGAIFGTPLDVSSALPAAASVKEIGRQLMGPHAIGLLIIGIILTVALLGAVVIAAQERTDNPEDFS